MAEPEIPGSADSSLETRALAVLLGRLAADEHALLDYLAGAFALALPDATTVHRRGLFNRGPAHAVLVHVGEAVYELRLQAGHVTCSIGSSVGGVALARQSVPLDAWVQRFTAALDEAARASDQVRASLARLA